MADDDPGVAVHEEFFGGGPDPGYRDESWKLADALLLIRKVQPGLHAIQYHAALGGGVLNKGESIKDLDIILIPFNGFESSPQAALDIFKSVLDTYDRSSGPTDWEVVTESDITASLTDEERAGPQHCKLKKMVHLRSGQRIDLFVQ